MTGKIFGFGLAIALAAALLLGGLAFIGWGGQLALSEITHPAIAAAAVGALLLLAASIVLLALAMVLRPSPQREEPSQSSSEGSSQALAQTVATELVTLIEQNPKAASLAALAVGAVFGASPELRKKAMDLI